MVSKKTFLKNLENSSLEFLEYGDEEYLKSIIEDDGGDIVEIEKRGESLFRRINFITNAKKANNKNEELMLIVVHKFKKGLEKNLEKPITTLKQLIKKKPQLLRARNLNKLNEDDIKELIKGHNLVELLNQLIEKKDND